jgi:hypothetical protein
MVATFLRRQAGRLAVAGAALVLASSAMAGAIADNASDAEQRAAAGDGPGAVSAFDAATDAFFDAVPLTLRVATFADAVTGFGNYTVHAGTYRASDTAKIYLEPVGYGFTRDGDGYRVSYGTALEIRTPGGLILGKTDDFGMLTWNGRARSHEVQAVLSVTLPAELKLRAGSDAQGRGIRQDGDRDPSVRHRRVAAATSRDAAPTIRFRSR